MRAGVTRPGCVHLRSLMRPAEVPGQSLSPGRAAGQPLQARPGEVAWVGASPSVLCAVPAPQSGRPSLKLLAERVLGIQVQQTGHCSVSGVVPALAAEAPVTCRAAESDGAGAGVLIEGQTLTVPSGQWARCL